MLYTIEAIKKRKERKYKIKKIINIIAYIILIPLLIYNISLIIQTIINPKETPSFFGIKTYVVVSGSMEPTLKIGDIIIVKNTNEELLKEGDIISFRDGQNVVTHRLTEIITENNEKKYKTKGDNNNTEDKKIKSINDIEGKMIGHIPTIGNFALMLQNKLAIIIIVIIFYTYLVNSEKLKRKKERRKIARLEYEKEKLKIIDQDIIKNNKDEQNALIEDKTEDKIENKIEEKEENKKERK